MQSDFRLGEWLVQVERRRIERGARSVTLRPKTMAVLACLAKAGGNPVSRLELFDVVWPGAEVSDDVLTTCIVELRKAFDDSSRAPQVIETIPKLGFRLIPNPEFIPAATGGANPDATVPRAERQAREDGDALVHGVFDSRSLAMALMLLVLGIGGVLFLVADNGTREPDAVSSTDSVATASVAVLPFANLSADPEQEYLADGLAEELLNLLVRFPGLQVVGRTSSFAFKGRNEDLREIGAALGVTRVVEGSVRRSGNRIRIAAQLIDVENGFHLWSEIYDRDLEDIFTVQDEIAGAIVAALEIHLQEEAPQRGLPTENLVAYGHYLEARFLRSQGRSMEAIDALQQALTLDPEFGEAHLLLSDTHIGLLKPTDQARFALIKKHVDAARKLDPDSVSAVAFGEMVDKFVESGQRAAAEGLEVYADLEGVTTALRLAHTSDPSNSQLRTMESNILLAMGYFQQALELADETLRHDPLFPLALHARGWALLGLGREEEGQATLRLFMDRVGNYGYYYFWALQAMVAGKLERAEDHIQAFVSASGQSDDLIRGTLHSVIDPSSRQAVVASPQWQATPLVVRALNLFAVGDPGFWALDDGSGQVQAVMFPAIVSRPDWLLQDQRFRSITEQLGYVRYWKNHPSPDFCGDGDATWICKL